MIVTNLSLNWTALYGVSPDGTIKIYLFSDYLNRPFTILVRAFCISEGLFGRGGGSP
jgi:hypothetical protein